MTGEYALSIDVLQELLQLPDSVVIESIAYNSKQYLTVRLVLTAVADRDPKHMQRVITAQTADGLTLFWPGIVDGYRPRAAT